MFPRPAVPTPPRRPLGIGFTPMETRRDVVLRVAVRAEELGYDAVFVGEGWGHDVSVLLAEVALRTSRIGLGTGIVNVWGRSAAAIAMLAASLDEVSGGRFSLGLGAGSPALAEGLHDVPFRRPVARLGETAREVRQLLDGGRIVSTVPGGARPLRLALHPGSRIPIELAALGPQAVRLAGELADSWCPFLLPRSGLKEGIRLLEEGWARGEPGRPLPRVRPSLPVAVSPDPAAAREVASWWVRFYLTSMGPLYPRTLRDAGFGEAVDAVLASVAAGDPGVPVEATVLLDELTLRGDAEAARASLDQWYSSGADMPVLALPPGRSPEELDGALVALAP